jgi:hypothetical protein
MPQCTQSEGPMMGAEGMAVSQVVVENAGSSGCVQGEHLVSNMCSLTDEDLPFSESATVFPIAVCTLDS